jgi:lipid II:glycine glycyltransferase (peptidoglycan interpeptide bridge formation enzyme)
MEDRRAGSDGDGGEQGSRVVDVTITPEPVSSLLQEWDRFVDTVPGSDVAQLSAWARIRSHAGFRPVYLFAHADGQLVGGALVLERRVPVVGRLGYSSGGPLVSPSVLRGPVVDRLVAALDMLARTRLRALFVQPPVEGQDVSTGLYARGFRPSTAEIAPPASIRINLRREVDDLRSRLTKANRRRARNWEQRGVSVRVGSADDAALVAELLARTAEHQRFEPLSPDYVQTLYRELDVGGHVIVFIAELDNSAVAALLCTRCNGTVRQRLSGMERTERARRDGVSAATVWNAILWAKSHGYNTYDFGGLSAAAAQVLLAGQPVASTDLTGSEQFKTSFGGEVFLYPDQVERISPVPLRLSYDILQRTRLGGRIIEIGKRVLRSGRALSPAPSRKHLPRQVR